MEKREEKRRIVLVPLPAQGHVTPMMQLGKVLNLKGFSITVVKGHWNQVYSSSHHFPGFQFITIRESLPDSEFKRIGPIEFMLKLNNTSEASFKDCIGQLLLQHGNDIACIVYDEFMYFCGAAATAFNLPSIIFSTTSATHKVCSSILGNLNVEKFLLDMKEHKIQNQVVENLHLFPYKDLTYEMGPLEPLFELCREVANKRTASAIITNTSNCLESSSLSWLEHEFGIPIYHIGPLHIAASLPTSLLEEDVSCIEWLDKHKPRSVMYISVGTVAQMETKEVLEMALGLCNSNQPFLWVIRPGSILGFNGTNSLPEEVRILISERGYIVKWAPQLQVLGHPAVGGFWSHCGWNSTLESIVEGVPMICKPFHGEQRVNATYVESVWRIGIQISGEVERASVERAVKRLMVEEESAGMRERALDLKEKLKASVRSGGSSNNALDELVKFLNTK